MKELIIIILSSMPVTGQQAAIFTAAILDMPIYKAFILSLIGSLVHPLPIVLLLYRYGIKLENQNNFIGHLFKWRVNALKKFTSFSTLSLFIIVAIPFPYLGSYAASILVWVLGLPVKQNVIAIMLGLVASNIIITLSIYSIFKIFDI